VWRQLQAKADLFPGNKTLLTIALAMGAGLDPIDKRGFCYSYKESNPNSSVVPDQTKFLKHNHYYVFTIDVMVWVTITQSVQRLDYGLQD
jgi:hypothetical protein